MTSTVQVLEDRVLAGLAHNASVLKVAPFLASLQAAAGKSGCGSCSAKRKDKAKLDSVKRQLATLPSAKMAELKALLHTKTVRFSFRAASGKIETLTL